MAHTTTNHNEMYMRCMRREREKRVSMMIPVPGMTGATEQDDDDMRVKFVSCVYFLDFLALVVCVSQCFYFV